MTEDEKREEVEAKRRVMRVWAGLVPKLQRVASGGEVTPLTPLEASELLVCMATTYTICEGVVRMTEAGTVLMRATLERWANPLKAVN